MAFAPRVRNEPLFFRLGKLRQLFDLAAALGQLDQPITTTEGLEDVLDLVADLADFLGIDTDWTARLRAVLDDEAVFQIVLAVIRYLAGLLESKPEA